MSQPLCLALVIFASTSLRAQFYPPTPSWTFQGPNLNALTGTDVGTAGDVNGDGHTDVYVFSSFSTGADTSGRVDVFYGDGSALPPTPSWSFSGLFPVIAVEMAGVGDLNDDGFDDFAIGDQGGLALDATFVPGVVKIFYGSANGLPAAPDVEIHGEDAGNDYYGSDVAGAGDVNGDGIDDLIVGAWIHYNTTNAEGAAYLYYGSAAGLDTVPDWTVYGDDSFAHLGQVVAGAGDVNDDGFDDVLVSAPFHHNGQQDEGQMRAYYGSASGPSTTPDWTFESDSAFAYLGYYSAGCAGDVNGDGYDDIYAGADHFEGMTGMNGKIWVFHGGSTGLPTTPSWTMEGTVHGTELGKAVAGIGDANFDGYDDLLAGDLATNGHARVYLGSSTGFGLVPDWVADSPTSGYSIFGYGVGAAGDVNSDGRMDVIVGEPENYVGNGDYGSAAYVYLAQISTAVDARSIDDVSVFPMPAGDQLRIGAPWRMEHWRLIDACGRSIQDGPLAAVASASIDLSAITSGSYVLEITGAHHRARRTVIIAR